MRFLRKLRRLQLALIDLYLCGISPYIAFKLTFLLWPFFKILEHCDCCFLTNVSLGVGQIAPEIDNFLRKKRLNEIDVNKKYVLVIKRHSISLGIRKLYGNSFFRIICSSFLYYLTHPLLIRYPSITIECGLARAKWNFLKDSDASNEEGLPLWPKSQSKQKNLDDWKEMYQRRLDTPGFLPFQNYKKKLEELDALLKSSKKKIALLHLKNGDISNSNAKNTDPATYLPMIEYLISKEYLLVFVGREKMPKEFTNYGVINYSESSIASFANDIQLFAMADLAVTGGSGIFGLADIFEVPILYLNFWHLFRLPSSTNTVCVPTLAQNETGKPLKFAEQWDLYLHMRDAKKERFPLETFQPRNATADEILMGCKELIRTKNEGIEMSPLQKEFQKLGAAFYPGKARMSAHFLEQHKTLF